MQYFYQMVHGRISRELKAILDKEQLKTPTNPGVNGGKDMTLKRIILPYHNLSFNKDKEFNTSAEAT